MGLETMTKVTDKQGQTANIRWPKVLNIISAYAYMRAFTECASLGREHLVQTVKFDHEEIRKLHNKYNNKLTPILVKEVHRSLPDAFARLVRLRRETLNWREERGGMFEECSKSAVRFEAAATVGLSLMQLARDGGIAMISIVGMPAGGVVALTAVAVTVTGSALAKYQDTGNREAALVAGTGTLVMCGAGAVTSIYRAGATGLDAGSKVLIGMGVMIDAAFEFGGAAVEGKTGKQACIAAMIKGMMGLGNAAIDESKIAKALGEKIDELDDLFKGLTSFKKATTKIGSAHVNALAKSGGIEMGKKTVEKVAMDYRPGAKKARRRPAMSSSEAVYIQANVLTLH